jgi:hypothetical protein
MLCLLPCGTIHLGSFEFIANYISGPSLYPRRGESGTAFMGSMRSGPPSPRWAMIEDSTKEFHRASRGGGGSDFPSPRRLGAGAPPAPVTTPLWQEEALAIQSMVMVQLWQLGSRPSIGHSCQRWHTPQEGQ